MSAPLHAGSAARWCLVVPVKRLAVAKTRLAGYAGQLRQELALAFASDTVRAALSCPAVASVTVVSDEPAAERELGNLGADVIADAPDDGLNPALRHGATVAMAGRPGAFVGALSADLPALRVTELAHALAAGAGFDRSFVPDADGTGTTLLLARALADFDPRFGVASGAAHQRAGAVTLLRPGLASVRRDVDTEADLQRALALGVGPRTRAVVASIAARRAGTSLPDVQATVRAFDPVTGSGSVVLDDGVELPYDGAAFAGSGLRRLRLGQRLHVQVEGGRGARRVTRLALTPFAESGSSGA